MSVWLVPRMSDSRLVTSAARSYFDELMRAGVRIWEYHGRMLHSKTIVVDHHYSMIGTANFDSRVFVSISKSVSRHMAPDWLNYCPINSNATSSAPNASLSTDISDSPRKCSRPPHVFFRLYCKKKPGLWNRAVNSSVEQVYFYLNNFTNPCAAISGSSWK